nr:hypothetical protein [Actinomycetota bacterium]
AQAPRQRRRRVPRPGRPSFAVSADRPYATIGVILASAVLLLVQKAAGAEIDAYGGLIVPGAEEWWRYLTAPFAYVDVG